MSRKDETSDAGRRAASSVKVRAAVESDADSLTELAVRSKGHWPYDAEFMLDARPELTITPYYLRTNPVFVGEIEGRAAGFYSLKTVGEEIELDNLFVEPRFIGYGLGKLLWQHSVERARRLGFRRMLIQSDPFAEQFYLAMGAKKIGEHPSNIRAGRMLPLLVFELETVADSG